MRAETGSETTAPVLAGEANEEADKPTAYQAASAQASSISREADFTRVYQTNSWGSAESRSGGGSTFKSTANIRQLMGLVFQAYSIKSLLDIPCGDCHWQNLIPGFNDTSYLGMDIVKVSSTVLCHGSIILVSTRIQTLHSTILVHIVATILAWPLRPAANSMYCMWEPSPMVYFCHVLYCSYMFYCS